MNALAGYFLMNLTKPRPFLEWIDSREYVDGTRGAWTQKALQGERTPSGSRPSDDA
jgi:hypothetical protein